MKSVGTKTFDAIVIGSGQDGNPLAHGLAGHGWSVALVEREHLGSTCINTGCTPTKTMVASAQVAHNARPARRWGVRAGGVTVDLRAVIRRKDAIVRRFRGGQEQKVKSRPRLALYRSHARFTGSRTVDVGDAVLESARIFVDTGTRPVVPDIPGLDTTGSLTHASLMGAEPKCRGTCSSSAAATSASSSARCSVASAAASPSSTAAPRSCGAKTPMSRPISGRPSRRKA